jgi:ATP phosphoribosyltransferase
MSNGHYNLTASDGTTAKHGVGDRINIKGAEYGYFKATAASIAAYSACSGATPAAMEEGTTTTATALGTAGGFACVPQFAVAASEYFWAPVGPFYLREDGVTTFKINAANAAAGAQLFSTATDGVLDDTSSGSTIELHGVALTETVTTAEAADCVAHEAMKWKP